MTLSAKTPVAQTLTAQKYFAGPAYISADPSGGTFYPQGENGMQDNGGGYLYDRGRVLSTWSDDSGGDFKTDTGATWINLPWARVEAFRLIRGGRVHWEMLADGYQTGGGGSFQTYRFELMSNGSASGVQLDFALSAHPTGFPVLFTFEGLLRVCFEPQGGSYVQLTGRLIVVDSTNATVYDGTKHYIMDESKFNNTIDQDLAWRAQMVTNYAPAGTDLIQFKSGGCWIDYSL